MVIQKLTYVDVLYYAEQLATAFCTCTAVERLRMYVLHRDLKPTWASPGRHHHHLHFGLTTSIPLPPPRRRKPQAGEGRDDAASGAGAGQQQRRRSGASAAFRRGTEPLSEGRRRRARTACSGAEQAIGGSSVT